MQELEKILKEIEKLKEMYKESALSLIDKGNLPCEYDKSDIESAKMQAISEAITIIRKHMNDGWIPVEKFGLPHSNEHDFRFWVTIQYTNGFRHTINAKWDCFDKCFIHQNGKKILQDVIAYKYYSAPEPYRPERSNEHDGE